MTLIFERIRQNQGFDLEGNFAYPPIDFEDGFNWLVSGRVEIDPWLIKAPLAEGGACFERLLDKPGPVAKILLHS
jgi:hypothetical protein